MAVLDWLQQLLGGGGATQYPRPASGVHPGPGDGSGAPQQDSPMDQMLDAEGNVIIRPMFPVGKWRDEGVYALPYQGEPTGDPVINQMRLGTYDRPPSRLDQARQYQLLNPGFPLMPASNQRPDGGTGSSLNWLQQLLSGGDPEAQGAAAASTAMMPVINQWAQNVASGNYVRQGLPSNYDPNQSFAQNALNPSGLENALNVALGVGGGSGLGIKAYHGSPYDFSAFDASKIGTGEGAQAYGHGLYFAENEGVARSYRDTLSKGNDPRDWINEIIGALNSPVGKPASASISREQLTTELQRYPVTAGLVNNDALVSHILNAANGYEAKSNTYSPSAMRSLQALDTQLPKPPPGKMYEVDINAEPQQFLDWDKPLSEQPQAVQDAMQGIARNYGPETTPPQLGMNWGDFQQGHLKPLTAILDRALADTPMQKFSQHLAESALSDKPNWDLPGVLKEFAPNAMGDVQAAIDRYRQAVSPVGATGEDWYRALINAAPEQSGLSLRQAAGIPLSEIRDTSQALNQAGIPGIRYLDQGSRGAGQGTSNYVVFDPSIIEILRKYGLAGLTAGGGLLGAADQQ